VAGLFFKHARCGYTLRVTSHKHKKVESRTFLKKYQACNMMRFSVSCI
jgi:hypothetical protein